MSPLNFLSERIPLIFNVAWTPIQKKVALIAAAIFACCILATVIYYNFGKIFSKKEVPSQPSLPIISQPSHPVEEPPQPPAQVAQKESVKPVSFTELPDFLPLFKRLERNQTSKTEKSIPERLEKNRQAALAQQAKEKGEEDKFQIFLGDLPPKIKVKRDRKKVETDLGGRKSIPENWVDQEVGLAFCQGCRSRMEDFHEACQGTLTIAGLDHPYKLFGVFDGHGGNAAASFVTDHLEESLLSAMKEHCKEGLNAERIFWALKDCCQKLDDKLHYKSSGTTATIAFIIDGKLWIANVGDSRALFIRDGKATLATEDADPENPRYENKVYARGGYLQKDFLCTRVNDDLNMTRSIGDKDILSKKNPRVLAMAEWAEELLKQLSSSEKIEESQNTEESQNEVIPQIPMRVISPRPKITCYDANFDYLLLATDGLFAGFLNSATTDIIGKRIIEMEKLGHTPMEMARRFVYTAIKTGKSTDNVTVVIVKNLQKLPPI